MALKDLVSLYEPNLSVLLRNKAIIPITYLSIGWLKLKVRFNDASFPCFSEEKARINDYFSCTFHFWASINRKDSR